MSRLSIVQQDYTDCGAACLASVAKYYRYHIPIAKIRLFASTDQLGTNMLGLISAAEKIGFEAKGVKGILDSLYKIPLPAIAHLNLEGQMQHYVVVVRISKKKITVMDPADGKLHIYKHADFNKQWTGVLLLLLPRPDFEANNEQSGYFQRILKLVAPHRKIWLQAAIGAIIYTVLGLSTSIFIQKITDHVIADRNEDLLPIMGLLMVAILVFQSFISVMKNLFVMRIGQHIDVNLILGYYRHLLRLPQHFFDRMRVGEIISRLNDAVKIRLFINDGLMNLIINILIVICSFGLMFTYYWKLAIMLLLSIPVYLAIYLVTNVWNKKTQRKLMEHSAELEAQLIESLNSISTIKQFGMEPFVNEKTDMAFIRMIRTVYQSGKNSIATSISVDISAKLMTIGLLWIGAKSVMSNEMSTGELFSFYALAAYFTSPISAIIGANKVMQDAMIAADRLFQIMDLDTETSKPAIAVPVCRLKGDIRFENVCFNYGTRSTVFKNLNLHIKSGSFTAIVGESGSGKSTVFSLMQQIYDVDSGTIRIGDYATKQISNATLRKYIAVVPQNITLFTGDIIENIAVGDTNPDMDLIFSICTQLGIINFIRDLPNGFHTHIGENGMSLSGGERQRIAIARALYRRPEILILDEATSSLDAIAEEYVKATIDLLVSQQKTIIVIAHRLSTIRTANQIIVLEKGTKVEEGNHLQLMEMNGHYSRLWAKQYS